MPLALSDLKTIGARLSKTTSYGIVKNALSQINYSTCTPQSLSAFSVHVKNPPFDVQSAKFAPRMKFAMSISSEITLFQNIGGNMLRGFLPFLPRRGILQRYYNYEFKCIMKAQTQEKHNICQFAVINCLVYLAKIMRATMFSTFAARNYLSRYLVNFVLF